MIDSLTQKGPLRIVELRSPASVSFGGKPMIIAFYRLFAYDSTILNDQIVESPFAGELYFTGEPPNHVQDDLVMHYEGSELLLHKCKIFERLGEIHAEVENLKFGIEFSYATKSTECGQESIE